MFRLVVKAVVSRPKSWCVLYLETCSRKKIRCGPHRVGPANGQCEPYVSGEYMSEEPAAQENVFSERDPSSCRVETQGGSVYWLSEPDGDGYRWVVREHLQSSDSNTMVMQKFSSSKESLDLGDKFRGKLAGDVQAGMPFVLEVSGRETRILSEVVVAIEVGNVPQMIFG